MKCIITVDPIEENATVPTSAICAIRGITSDSINAAAPYYGNEKNI